MKILFITSNRLGDAVLSTGLLNHIIDTYPKAKITVACGGLGEALFLPMPNVERVIVFNKQSYSRHWVYLFKECFKTKWDMIIDIRNSAVSRLLMGKQKFIWQGIDKSQHKVEQMAELMHLDYTPVPKLWFSDEQQKVAQQYIPSDIGKVLAIGPAANWIGKTWSIDCFIELIERLTAKDGILPEASVAIFAAPDEEDVAYQVLDSIPKERQINVIAKLNPGQSAAVLSRSALYIGNDSGLMHCAAAVGVPTLGLFGPGYPEQYRPWGISCAYVATPKTADELFADIGKDASEVTQTLMGSLSVDAVEKTAQELWANCAVL